MDKITADIKKFEDTNPPNSQIDYKNLIQLKKNFEEGIAHNKKLLNIFEKGSGVIRLDLSNKTIRQELAVTYLLTFFPDFNIKINTLKSSEVETPQGIYYADISMEVEKK